MLYSYKLEIEESADYTIEKEVLKETGQEITFKDKTNGHTITFYETDAHRE